MRLVRIAGKGSKTILHRGFTESIKNILKTIKLTEDTDIRKAMAIHWREASDRQEHWLMHWGWLKSDRTCTQAMLAVFPLTTARDRHWWSHCRFLGWPEMSTSFFARQLKKGAVDLPYTSGIDCNWLKVAIVKKVIVFSAFVGLSISCYTAWYMRHWLCSDFLQRCPQLSRPIQGSCLCTRSSGWDHRAFYLSSGQRAQGQRGDQFGSMIVWGWSLWLNVVWVAACILNARKAMKSQPVNKLPTVAFRAFKNIGTSSFAGQLRFGAHQGSAGFRR